MCKRQKLMTQTNSKSRYLHLRKLFKLLDYLHILRRISRSIWKHYAVRCKLLYPLCLCICRNNSYLAASLNKLSSNVVLCTKIVKHYLSLDLSLRLECLLLRAGRVLYSLNYRVVLQICQSETWTLRNDLSVHNTRLTNYFCELTSVDTVKTNDVMLL